MSTKNSNNKTNNKKKSTKETINKNNDSKFKVVAKNILEKLKAIFYKVKEVTLKFLSKHWQLIILNVIN